MIARARAFYEAARTPRTCRFFAPDPVPREVIDYAIRAAGTAPSGATVPVPHCTYLDRFAAGCAGRAPARRRRTARQA